MQGAGSSFLLLEVREFGEKRIGLIMLRLVTPEKTIPNEMNLNRSTRMLGATKVKASHAG